MTFGESGCPVSCVICPVLRLTCHLSPVKLQSLMPTVTSTDPSQYPALPAAQDPAAILESDRLQSPLLGQDGRGGDSLQTARNIPQA